MVLVDVEDAAVVANGIEVVVVVVVVVDDAVALRVLTRLLRTVPFHWRMEMNSEKARLKVVFD